MPSFFSKIFGGGSTKETTATEKAAATAPAPAAPPQNTTQSLQEIEQAIDTLNRREEVILKKIDAEIELAKKHMAADKKHLALECMKRKKRYNDQLEVISSQRGNLETVQITLEEQALAQAVTKATAHATSIMKRTNAQMDVDKVQQVHEDLREQIENHNDVVNILKESVDVNPVDQDDLEAELMAEMAKDKPKVQQRTATGPAPAGKAKTAADLAAEAELAKLSVPTGAPKKTQKQLDEEDDLRRLEAELAS